MTKRAMSIFSTELDVQLEYRKVCIEENMDHNQSLEEFMRDIIRTRGYKTRLERIDKGIEDLHHERDLTIQKQIQYEREKSLQAEGEVEKILLTINNGGRQRYQNVKALFNEMNNLAKKYCKPFLEVQGYYEQKAPVLIFDVDDLGEIQSYLEEIRNRYQEMTQSKEDFVQASIRRARVNGDNNGNGEGGE